LGLLKREQALDKSRQGKKRKMSSLWGVRLNNWGSQTYLERLREGDQGKLFSRAKGKKNHLPDPSGATIVEGADRGGMAVFAEVRGQINQEGKSL